MSILQLKAAQRGRLQEQLHTTHDARVYRRTLAVLQVGQGQRVEQVASLLEVSARSVWRWLESYRSRHDPQALADQPGQGRPDRWDAEDWAVLKELAADRPQDRGYPATQWTVPLLRAHLSRGGLSPCSPDTLRRRLHELGWVWKRPRYVLDPEAEKKRVIRSRLMRLPPRSAVLFEDETVPLLDENSSHHCEESQGVADDLDIELLFLPKRAPHLNGMDQLWRRGKQTVSANWQYPSIDEHVSRFTNWVLRLSAREARDKAGILSEDFWLQDYLAAAGPYS